MIKIRKTPKWRIAADFLEKNGKISSGDVAHVCNTVSPHKFLMILKEKVGLEELENTGKPYKIFIKANKQLRLQI